MMIGYVIQTYHFNLNCSGPVGLYLKSLIIVTCPASLMTNSHLMLLLVCVCVLRGVYLLMSWLM